MKWIPKILSLLMLWGAVFAVVYYIDPELLKDIIIPGLYLPFFILLCLAIWYTLVLFLHMVWNSLIVALTIVSALILSTLGLMHIGLAIVILLTLGIESMYIYLRYEKIKSSHEQKNRGSGI